MNDLPRPLADIRRDLNQAKARVLDLQAELRECGLRDKTIRDPAIVAASLRGESVKAIAAQMGLTVNTVYGVLDRNDLQLRKRVTPISHLPAEQQRMHDKLRSAGYGPGVARQLATAVT